jgi:hypothetical protein
MIIAMRISPRSARTMKVEPMIESLARRRISIAVVALLTIAGFTGVTSNAVAQSAPTVTSLAPSRGDNAKRPLVAIAGSGFTSGTTVTFAGRPATEVAMRSSTLLYARPPSQPELGTVHVRVRTAAGQSTPTLADRYTTTIPPVAPDRVVSLGIGRPEQMSCPTVEFCMILGHDGRAITVHGTTAGSLIDLPLDSPSRAVSCTSPTFCAAVSANQATTFDGSSWAPPITLAGEPTPANLSCSGPQFCVTIADHGGTWWRYDGMTWTSSANGPRVGSGSAYWAVSCVSASFCMAEGEWPELTDSDPDGYLLHGRIFRFNGSNWVRSDAFNVTADNPTNVAVSCVSTTYCMADEPDGAYTYNGEQWTKRDGYPGTGAYLECFAVDRCMTWDFATFGSATRHRLFRFDGAQWTNLGRVPPRTSAIIDCSSTDDCAVVGSLADQWRYTGATGWSGPHPLGNWLSDTTAVSCVAGPHCVMVNAHGQAATWDGSTWSQPTTADAAARPTSVSCATATSCVLVDDAGNALTFDGATWSAPERIDTRQLNQVSCATSAFCVAVDEGGYVVRFEGGTWHTPTLRNPSGALRGVSCISSTFCMAVGKGDVTRYHGAGTWTAAKHIALYASGVSCTSRSFCMVRTGNSSVRIWGGQVFSPPRPLRSLPHGNYRNVLSCTAPQFCALVTQLPLPYYVAAELDGAAGTNPAFLGFDDTWGPVSCFAPRRCVFLAAGTVAVETR